MKLVFVPSILPPNLYIFMNATFFMCSILYSFTNVTFFMSVAFFLNFHFLQNKLLYYFTVHKQNQKIIHNRMKITKAYTIKCDNCITVTQLPFPNTFSNYKEKKNYTFLKKLYKKSINCPTYFHQTSTLFHEE